MYPTFVLTVSTTDASLFDRINTNEVLDYVKKGENLTLKLRIPAPEVGYKLAALKQYLNGKVDITMMGDDEVYEKFNPVSVEAALVKFSEDYYQHHLIDVNDPVVATVVQGEEESGFLSKLPPIIIMQN